MRLNPLNLTSWYHPYELPPLYAGLILCFEEVYSIPKWLIYVHLCPYAELVPRGYSLDLEKECWRVSWPGLQLRLKESLSTSRVWL